MSPDAPLTPGDGDGGDRNPKVDITELERSLRHPRALFSFAMSWLTGLVTVFTLVPLFSVLYLLIVRGGRNLGMIVFTDLPPAALTPGGGFGNAVIGTILMVAIATLLSVPTGILAAIFLADFAPESRTASAVRFTAKVLTGLPSILAGVFAYAAVVVTTGTFSAPAGGVALALLMLPIVLLTAEEALRAVPAKMREAAIGMGATPTQVALKILLPTALPGILTGVMLAIARAAGETAPLLFTALFSEYWMSTSSPEFLPKSPGDLFKPTASLAVLIYNFSGSPFDHQIDLAWTAALVLVVMVLAVNLVGQSLARRHV